MASYNIRFEMRVPESCPVKREDMYAAALDMAQWADGQGFTACILSEHHGVEDGHLSSPLTLAGAIAGRTERIQISVCALLAPLYDPIRLAEDLATLDLLSRGRVSVTAGLGYRPAEYAAMRKDFKRRGKLMDEVLETLLAAWTGEPFDYHGERVRVTPRPYTRPHPVVIVGGSTPAAAKRAARLGLPFGPPLSDDALNQLYLDECARHGVKAPFVVDPGEPRMTFVSEDPDRGWQEVGPYLLHDALSYASWQRDDQRSFQHCQAKTVDELRAEGKYRVLTPEQCLEIAESEGAAATFHHFPLGGGTPPDVGWKSLRLFADKVVPHLSQ